MKKKLLTAFCTILVFIPWTIFPLRKFAWTLQSPAAEIIISCYAIFMMFGGIFTSISYGKANVKNTMMKLCLVINNLYAVLGLIVVSQILFHLFS